MTSCFEVSEELPVSILNKNLHSSSCENIDPADPEEKAWM